MGVRAAEVAVTRAGIDPGEIDVLVYCSARFYDYRIGLRAASSKTAISEQPLPPAEVKNGCNSRSLGIISGASPRRSGYEPRPRRLQRESSPYP